MGRWKAFGVALVIVAGAGCTSGSEAEARERPANRLPNGLAVPKGARLIGIPIPQLAPPTSDTARAGWLAILRIDRKPRHVFESYVASVGKSHPPALSFPGCVTVGHPNRLLCHAGNPDSTGLQRFVDLRLQACSKCSPAGSIMQVGFYGPGVSYGPVTEHKPPPVTPGGVRRPLIVPAKGWSGRVRALPGSRLLVSAEKGGLDNVRGILEVTGDADEVWNRYVQSAGGEPVGNELRAEHQGRKIRQLSTALGEGETTFTMVRGRGLRRPLLTVETFAYN